MNKQRKCRLGLYEKAMPNSLPWTAKLEAAKTAGFDFVEISIDETAEKQARLDWKKPERDGLIRAMRSSGIGIRTMCLSGHRKWPLGSHDPAIRARSLEIMEKAVCLADDLGVRLIQLAGYDVYYETGDADTQRWFEENLHICVEMAARYGVILAFETMETAFMDTVSKALRYVGGIASPYLQIYPDLGNLTNAAAKYHSSLAQDLACGKGHIAAMHLKETLPGQYREVPFGAGHVDFQTYTRQVQDMGVSLFVTEFWHKGEADWAEKLAEARAFIAEKTGI